MNTSETTSTVAAAEIVDAAYPAELLAKIEEQQFSSREVSEILLDFQMSVSIADLAKQTRAIVVTDESQTDLMLQARTLRLQLKNERVRIEKARVAIKEPHLRRVQVIDGLSRTVKQWFETEEEYLQQQEDFAKLREAERFAARAEERLNLLLEHNFNDHIPGLGNMTEDAFELLLAGAKAKFQEQVDRIKKEEEDRKKREQDAEELRLENDRLRQEREEADRKRQEAEAEATRQREEKEAAEKARQAQIKQQEEDAAQKERDRVAAEEAEKRRIADEKAKAAAAPDREKLLLLADNLCAVELPTMSTTEGKALLESFIADRNIIADLLRKSAENLRAPSAAPLSEDDCPF